VSDNELELASRLLAAHLSEAVARFGAAALDVVDLPPLSGERIEPAQLKAAAALFWAKEVDEAGVLEFVDELAEGVRLGRFAGDFGRANALLFAWHRQRSQRLDGGERHAIYDRLFGGEVQELFDRLVAGLVRVARLESATPDVLATLSVAAEELAGALSERSAGIAAFAAREIVDSIREALAILHSPEVLAAFGQRSLPELLASAGPMVVGRRLAAGAHFERARSGQLLLSWLSEVALELGGASLRLTPTDPVVHAACAWDATAPAQAARASQAAVVVPPASQVSA
jgi:hypothetical protein